MHMLPGYAAATNAWSGAKGGKGAGGKGLPMLKWGKWRKEEGGKVRQLFKLRHHFWDDLSRILGANPPHTVRIPLSPN